MSAKQAEGKEGRGLTVADIQNYNPQDTSKVKGDYPLAEIIDRVQHPEAYWFPKEVGIELVTRYREDIALPGGPWDQMPAFLDELVEDLPAGR